jgi:hypothetical protein
MGWTVPRFGKSRIDWAGRVLVDPHPPRSDRDLALEVINNWRSSHSFPLNTFQNYLRFKARDADSQSLIAQRIKRLSSIKAKLIRFSTMKLSQMQDIGGCRGVVLDCPTVFGVRKAYLGSRLKHKLVREDDYISHPKASGYRSLHLIYRYFSDRKTTYNGLQIEMQLRSQLQHAWATAVETVGTFLEQSLKASQGTPTWLHFFELMGSAMAFREGTALVPGTATTEEKLISDIRTLDKELEVATKLRAYGQALRAVEQDVGDARYFLLDLRPAKETITITGFNLRELEIATERYLEVEKSLSGPGSEAVLVSVSSLDSLRAAYPNYFLDTDTFLKFLDETVG